MICKMQDLQDHLHPNFLATICLVKWELTCLQLLDGDKIFTEYLNNVDKFAIWPVGLVKLSQFPPKLRIRWRRQS